MAYYLRAPKDELVSMRGHGADAEFVRAAPLAMHDKCAKRNGVAGAPRAEGRVAFAELAGQDLCWSPMYATGENAPPCFYCGDAVAGVC